jgi:hypothetical protein
MQTKKNINMKQLLPLFLFLLPCLALAQYPSNGNQKITLGEQTTADGLIYRGVLADTGIITPSSDTSAYIILDTVNHRFYNYNRATNVWSVAGGGTAVTTFSGGTTGLTPSTATSGAITLGGTLAVANGGTGATVKIFVDTINTQTVNGLKTFKDSIFLGNVVIGKTKQNNNSIRFGINSGLSTADKNVAIGTNTLQKNTGDFSGNGENTAIGFEAGKNLTTGIRNMLLGSNAGSAMTTGGSTVAIGATALLLSTSASEVVAIGRAAMEQGLSGDRNTAIGNAALYKNDGGNDNTAIGYRAGWANNANNNTTGSNNSFIGNEALGASATASNVITLGNSSIATIRAQVTTITSLSDIRDKTNIMPLNYGIDFIKKLNPVSFDWDMRDGGKIGISEIGFIAQELQQAQIDSQINIPNLVSDINPDKLEASYGVLIPIMVKALKEQQALIDELKQRILNLENK